MFLFRPFTEQILPVDSIIQTQNVNTIREKSKASFYRKSLRCCIIWIIIY